METPYGGLEIFSHVIEAVVLLFIRRRGIAVLAAVTINLRVVPYRGCSDVGEFLRLVSQLQSPLPCLDYWKQPYAGRSAALH